MESISLKAGEKVALSVGEAAQAAGLGRSGLYLAIRAGKLTTLKVGGRRLVRPADLNAWLEKHATA